VGKKGKHHCILLQRILAARGGGALSNKIIVRKNGLLEDPDRSRRKGGVQNLTSRGGGEINWIVPGWIRIN